jgi:hypothetical protein
MSRILTQSGRFKAVEEGTEVIWRIPLVPGKEFGMNRKRQGLETTEKRASVMTA